MDWTCLIIYCLSGVASGKKNVSCLQCGYNTHLIPKNNNRRNQKVLNSFVAVMSVPPAIRKQQRVNPNILLAHLLQSHCIRSLNWFVFSERIENESNRTSGGGEKIPPALLIGYCIIVHCRFALCYRCLNHTYLQVLGSSKSLVQFQGQMS